MTDWGEFDIPPELAQAALAAGLLEVDQSEEAVHGVIYYKPTPKGLERMEAWLKEQTIHDCPGCDLPKLADEDYLCPACRASSDKN